MTQEIRFKTALTPLEKGGKPCYRAVPVTNGSTDMNTLAIGAAARIGMDEAMMQYISELFLEQVEAAQMLGKRIEVEGLFSGAIAVQGLFDAANAPWERGKHRLAPFFAAKGAMKTVYDGAVGVNVTKGSRCRITSVIDAIAKTEGVITHGEDVAVYAAGGTFLIDTSADDEGVWLEDSEGEIVAFGTVTASTNATLDVTFATLPAPGEYKFVVATRGGMGEEYGVTIARRSVTVVEA